MRARALSPAKPFWFHARTGRFPMRAKVVLSGRAVQSEAVGMKPKRRQGAAESGGRHDAQQ
jgi:hypothetical protein